MTTPQEDGKTRMEEPQEKPAENVTPTPEETASAADTTPQDPEGQKPAAPDEKSVAELVRQARESQKKEPEAVKPKLTAAEKRKRRRRRRWRAFRMFLFRLIFFVLVVYVLVFHIVGITTMPSGDMYPRIDMKDLVLFYRLDETYKYQNVVVIDKAVDEDGAVIVENPPEKDWIRKALDFLGFEDPNMPKTTRFVLRVVAVPGDVVNFPEGGSITVNGNALVESNIFYTTQVYEGYENYPITLGENEYFVMADYRRGGVDSRFFGPVTADEIQGTVITIMRRNNL